MYLGEEAEITPVRPFIANMRVNIPKGYQISLCYECYGKDFMINYDNLQIKQRVKPKARIVNKELFKNDTRNQTIEIYDPVPVYFNITKIDSGGLVYLEFSERLTSLEKLGLKNVSSPNIPR